MKPCRFKTRGFLESSLNDHWKVVMIVITSNVELDFLIHFFLVVKDCLVVAILLG